jgi:DNA-binding NarL/FixJ family response regulator
MSPGSATDEDDGAEPRARIALAEDDMLLRAGLASLLERSGYEIVGEAADPDTLLTVVREQRPDLAIVDIRMPPTHTSEGLDAARVIRNEFPETRILVLSAYAAVDEACDVLGWGNGTGYLLKGHIADAAEFLDDVERIARGGSVVDPTLVQELVEAVRASDPLEQLSRREREVLALMAEGRSNSGIARRLFISEWTVEKHVRNIFKKLRIPGGGDDHRRVLAVLAFLDER